MVTGAATGWTLDSSRRSSFTFWVEQPDRRGIRIGLHHLQLFAFYLFFFWAPCHPTTHHQSKWWFYHLAQLLEVLLRQVLALLEDLDPLFRISHVEFCDLMR